MHVALFDTNSGTLVVCPVIALTQWKTEIEKFTDGSLTVRIYHGPDRESQTPREMLKKYDVVLTTYQVVEADFRKMTSPNRVECPNCGGKFKFDKLPVHLKYFCGATAQKTEAQARQRRSTDRVDLRGRRGRGADTQSGKSAGTMGKVATELKQKQKAKSTKQIVAVKGSKKPIVPDKNINSKIEKALSKTASKKTTIKSVEKVGQPTSRPSRSAARRAVSQIKKSAAEWMPPEEDDLDSDTFNPESTSAEVSVDESSESSDTDSNSSALQRARKKQQQALDSARTGKGNTSKKFNGQKKSCAVLKKTGKKTFTRKGKSSNDDFHGSSDSDGSADESKPEIDINMEALVLKAMEGGKTDCIIFRHSSQ